jgi:putative salt-induced outer membrane protein YdiY
MSTKLSILAITLLCSIAFADQVTLKNGDRVTGKIVQKDGAKLTMKTDLMGEVTIEWANVTALTSDDPLTVVLPGGQAVQGKVETAGDRIQVAQQTAPLAEVPAIRNPDAQRAYERLLNPGWTQLWTGYFDFGLALARGNAETTTITTALAASRATRSDRTTAYFNQVYASARNNAGVTSSTAQAIRGGWAYNRDLNSRLFLNVFNDYEFDRFQRLDLRVVAGGGAGYHVIKNENTTFDLLGGISWNREDFASGLLRNSAEVYYGDFFSHKLNSRVSLVQSFRMFSNLSDFGAYRINFDAGVNASLTKTISLQTTFSDRYLSNPLPGRKKNDILFTTGVRVNFAR